MAHLYKNRLQNFAQKRSIPFPVYACETQGPPHARLFKARVTINGSTYEGPEFCTTLKDAEHAAAKVAFTALSPDGTEEDDCLYKSLLQELAQKRGLLLPVYVTTRVGAPHMPYFTSSVEIAGECYVGEESRTKKQSEMNAAKLAYIAHTKGGSRANTAAVSPDPQMVGTSSFGSQMVVAEKKEPALISNLGKMQTTINDQANYSIAKEAGKAKGVLRMNMTLGEDIEKDTVTMPPVMIHQSQPKATPTVVNAVKPNIRRENLIPQAYQAHQGSGSGSGSGSRSGSRSGSGSGSRSGSRSGSGSNGRRNQINRSSVNEGVSNPVTDSGATRPPPATKIVIRPNTPGMTYEGTVQISDDNWVAMEVKADMEN